MQCSFQDTVIFSQRHVRIVQACKERKKQYYRRRSDGCAEDVDRNDGEKKRKRTRLRHLKTRLGPIILSSDERRAHRSCTRRKSVTRRFYVTVTRLTRFRFPAVYFKRYRGHWPLTWPERFYDFTALSVSARFRHLSLRCIKHSTHETPTYAVTSPVARRQTVFFFCFSFSGKI